MRVLLLYIVCVLPLACGGQSMYMRLTSNIGTGNAPWLLDESTPYPHPPIAFLSFFVERNADSSKVALTLAPVPTKTLLKRNATKAPGPSPRRKRRPNLTRTVSLQRQRRRRTATMTVPFPTESQLSWEISSIDGGRNLTKTEAVGTRLVQPTTSANGRFTEFMVGQITVTEPGPWKLAARVIVAGFSNVILEFAARLVVRPLPRRATSETATLYGSNGSSLVPGPKFILADRNGDQVGSLASVATLTIVKGPPGSRLTGSLKRVGVPESGVLIFDNIAVNLPGSYDLGIVVALPDGTSFTSELIALVIRQAYPTRLVSLSKPRGAMLLVFPSVPAFGLFDELGPAADPGARITLRITLDRPSIVYTTRKANPSRILGETTVPIHHHSFVFSNFSMDTPGVHQITATVLTSHQESFSSTVTVVCNPLPTFLPAAKVDLIVNSPSYFTLFGSLPTPNATAHLKLHKLESCQPQSDDLSMNVPWPGTGIAALIPHSAADVAFLCLSIRGTKEWVSMMRHYVQKFDEAFPISKTFRIAPVGQCSPLEPSEAIAYREEGWGTAEANRRYGCRLDPPVVGTVPPCSCPIQLRCESFRHPSFTPGNLDIGRCMCCAPWVLTTAWVLCAIFIACCLRIVLKMF